MCPGDILCLGSLCPGHILEDTLEGEGGGGDLQYDLSSSLQWSVFHCVTFHLFASSRNLSRCGPLCNWRGLGPDYAIDTSADALCTGFCQDSPINMTTARLFQNSLVITKVYTCSAKRAEHVHEGCVWTEVYVVGGGTGSLIMVSSVRGTVHAEVRLARPWPWPLFFYHSNYALHKSCQHLQLNFAGATPDIAGCIPISLWLPELH